MFTIELLQAWEKTEDTQKAILQSLLYVQNMDYRCSRLSMNANHEASKDTITKNKGNAAYISQFYEAWKDSKTKSMQNASYIRQLYEAWKDTKMKSMQNASYIRQFHASPKSARSPLKPKVSKMLRIFINFVKK